MRSWPLVRTGRQILWWLLVIAIATIPAVELACNEGLGEAHERQHVHASPGLLVEESCPRFISTPGPLVATAPVHPDAGVTGSPFVPPRS
jgi:hypothetical protein